MRKKTVIAGLVLCAVAAAGIPFRAAEPAKLEIPKGMVLYYFGFLKRGPKWSPGETPERQKIQEGHMAHIRDMAATGKLVAAGPFLDDGDPRGVLIFKTASLEEAKKLAEEDPAVKVGRLAVEIRPWMVGEGVINEHAAHESVSKH